eukprot:scaffold272191_cov35-Tisochrysis_lutea.AAC.1
MRRPTPAARWITKGVPLPDRAAVALGANVNFVDALNPAEEGKASVLLSLHRAAQARCVSHPLLLASHGDGTGGAAPCGMGCIDSPRFHPSLRLRAAGSKGCEEKGKREQGV